MWMTVRYDQVMTVMRGALLDSHLGRTRRVAQSSARAPHLRAQTSRSAPGNSSKI